MALYIHKEINPKIQQKNKSLGIWKIKAKTGAKMGVTFV